MNVLVVLLLITFPIISATPRASPRRHLLQTLFASYDPRIRPVINDATAVNVSISVASMDLIEKDSNNNIFQLRLMITQTWKDEFLVWDPQEHHDIVRIQLQPYTGTMNPVIWTPDITSYTGKMEQMDIFPEKAFINHFGNVTWEWHRLLTLPCNVETRPDVGKRVKCTAAFGSWVHTVADVDVKILSVEGFAGEVASGSKWQLAASTATRTLVEHSRFPHPLVEINFTLEYIANNSTNI